MSSKCGDISIIYSILFFCQFFLLLLVLSSCCAYTVILIPIRLHTSLLLLFLIYLFIFWLSIHLYSLFGIKHLQTGKTYKNRTNCHSSQFDRHFCQLAIKRISSHTDFQPFTPFENIYCLLTVLHLFDKCMSG